MMHPTSAELRRVCALRGTTKPDCFYLTLRPRRAERFVKDNADDLRTAHGDRGVRFGIA
jgi:hypothetical protein